MKNVEMENKCAGGGGSKSLGGQKSLGSMLKFMKV